VVIDTTDVDAEQPWGRGTFTIRLPFCSIITDGCFNQTPPPPFTGWPLSGSCTNQDGRDVITTATWSWDLQPRFDARP